jgi:hypothetical protein
MTQRYALNSARVVLTRKPSIDLRRHTNFASRFIRYPFAFPFFCACQCAPSLYPESHYFMPGRSLQVMCQAGRNLAVVSDTLTMLRE